MDEREALEFLRKRGFICLAAKEAERVAGCIQLTSHGIITANIEKEWAACRLLLTPEQP